MDRYQSRVEEFLTLKRRTKQSLVRQMILIKEAEQGGRLTQFANDIDMTLKTTGNYLVAYDGYVERGLMPESFTDADAVEINPAVYEIWDEVYDYTLFTQRYDGADRSGVQKVAKEMGLKGFGKALDIAKNPKSMTAAILGDHRAAVAAVEAVLRLAANDPLIAASIIARSRATVHRDNEGRALDAELQRTPTEALMGRLGSLNHDVRRLNAFEVPEGMEDFVIQAVTEARQQLDDLLTVLEGRRSLDTL